MVGPGAVAELPRSLTGAESATGGTRREIPASIFVRLVAPSTTGKCYYRITTTSEYADYSPASMTCTATRVRRDRLFFHVLATYYGTLMALREYFGTEDDGRSGIVSIDEGRGR